MFDLWSECTENAHCTNSSSKLFLPETPASFEVPETYVQLKGGSVCCFEVFGSHDERKMVSQLRIIIHEHQNKIDQDR